MVSYEAATAAAAAQEVVTHHREIMYNSAIYIITYVTTSNWKSLGLRHQLTSYNIQMRHYNNDYYSKFRLFHHCIHLKGTAPQCLNQYIPILKGDSSNQQAQLDIRLEVVNTTIFISISGCALR